MKLTIDNLVIKRLTLAPKDGYPVAQIILETADPSAYDMSTLARYITGAKVTVEIESIQLPLRPTAATNQLSLPEAEAEKLVEAEASAGEPYDPDAALDVLPSHATRAEMAEMYNIPESLLWNYPQGFVLLITPPGRTQRDHVGLLSTGIEHPLAVCGKEIGTPFRLLERGNRLPDFCARCAKKVGITLPFTSEEVSA